MRAAVGALVASGFSLDQIFSWPWDQISMSAEAVTAYHAKLLDTGLRAVAGAFGVEATGVKHGASKASAKTDEERANQQVSELRAFAALGIPINVGGKRVSPGELAQSVMIDRKSGG